MDLPTVEYVVSYDVPLDIRKYVHRVGRTARAGRAGTAWTLVEKQEVSISTIVQGQYLKGSVGITLQRLAKQCRKGEESTKGEDQGRRIETLSIEL